MRSLQSLAGNQKTRQHARMCHNKQSWTHCDMFSVTGVNKNGVGISFNGNLYQEVGVGKHAPKTLTTADQRPRGQSRGAATHDTPHPATTNRFETRVGSRMYFISNSKDPGTH